MIAWRGNLHGPNDTQRDRGRRARRSEGVDEPRTGIANPLETRPVPCLPLCLQPRPLLRLPPVLPPQPRQVRSRTRNDPRAEPEEHARRDGVVRCGADIPEKPGGEDGAEVGADGEQGGDRCAAGVWDTVVQVPGAESGGYAVDAGEGEEEGAVADGV